VRLLAIAAERERGTTWEAIGERLRGEPTRQAVQKRFGDAVEQLRKDIVLPVRAGAYPGAPGWTAAPGGVEDPDGTLSDLDAWAARHAEATDAGRGRKDLVSAGLSDERWHIAEVGVVTQLARWILDSALPDGVTERQARRLLLERRLRLADHVARTATGTLKRQSQDLAAQTWDELLAWHREDLAERVTGQWASETEAWVLLDVRHRLAHLWRVTDPGVDGGPGWYCSHPALLEPGGADVWLDEEPVAGVDASRDVALRAAIARVVDHAAGDQAKGVGPLDAGGIAGAASA
jgi:hypothetical protein